MAGSTLDRPDMERARREARVAGLRDFRTPSLESIERRRMQLLALNAVVLLTVVAGVFAALDVARGVGRRAPQPGPPLRAPARHRGVLLVRLRPGAPAGAAHPDARRRARPDRRAHEPAARGHPAARGRQGAERPARPRRRGGHDPRQRHRAARRERRLGDARRRERARRRRRAGPPGRARRPDRARRGHRGARRAPPRADPDRRPRRPGRVPGSRRPRALRRERDVGAARAPRRRSSGCST